MITTPDMQARIRREVAMPSRLGHTALLASSAIVGTVVASLLLTEPSLPARTQWAFTGIVAIAACWVVYAGWVLARRRVLFGTQRVAAAGLACLFTAVAFAGSVVLRDRVGLGAVLTMATLMVIAGIAMFRAARHVRRLQTLAEEISRREVAR